MPPRRDGGPAFPEYEAVGFAGRSALETKAQGMTLRDYFAAKAMQAVLMVHGDRVTMSVFPSVAHEAYAVADAMLAEREK